MARTTLVLIILHVSLPDMFLQLLMLLILFRSVLVVAMVCSSAQLFQHLFSLPGRFAK
uniref:Uncharacterized protein n=1 Tax=Octopus bimaculoides TaxID=37653 RepID=A0A0L8IIU7_OCTBM